MLLFNTRERLFESEGQSLVKKSPWPKVISMLAISAIIVYLISYANPAFETDTFFKYFKNLFIFKDSQIGLVKTTVGETFQQALELLVDTLAISLLGTLIGILIAIPLSLLSSKNITKNPFIYTPIRWVMSLIRSVPPLIYAFMFYNLFDGPLSASISLAIFVSSITVKWLYEYLDTIDLKTYNSLIALGLSKPRAIVKAIMPELMKKVVSYGLYAFEMVIRFAAILGIVGIKTIGYLLTENKELSHWGHLTVVLSVLVITILLIELFTVWIKRYVLQPTLKQADLDKTQSLESQIKSLNEQRSKSYITQRLSVVLLFALILFSTTRVNFQMANEAQIELFKTGWKNLFNPDWSYLTEFGTGSNAIELAMDTLLVAFLAAVFGAIFGLIFGILASTNITGKITAWLFKAFIITTRSIPTFVYAIVFVISAYESIIWVGVLAMGIRSIGMLGKLTYEKIESVDKGGKLSMDVVGNTVFNSTRVAVISEAIPAVISNALYRVEINFKTAIELGAVGASTFGLQIIVFSTPSNYDRLTPFILVIIAVVLILEQISALIRNKLMRGYFISSNNFMKKYLRKNVNYKAIISSSALGVKYPNSEMGRRYVNMKNIVMAHEDPLYKNKLATTKQKIEEEQVVLTGKFEKSFAKEIEVQASRVNSFSKEVSDDFNPIVYKESKKVLKQMKNNKNKNIYKSVKWSLVEKYTK